MATKWLKFDFTTVAKVTHDDPMRILVVAEHSGKQHVGICAGLNPTTVQLKNGQNIYAAKFDGGWKKFTYIDPPVYEVKVKESELQLNGN